MPSSRQTTGTVKLASTRFRVSMILPISKFRTLHVELLYIRENSTSDDFGSGGSFPSCGFECNKYESYWPELFLLAIGKLNFNVQDI